MIVDDDYYYTVQTIGDAIATLKALKPLRKMHRFDDFPVLPPPILITDPVILATGQSGLGHDLVSEILMRLPVKSLMRFKCVHRSFNALFRTPTFITGHMMMHKLKHKEERLVIFENYEKPHCMISDDPSQSPINLEFEIPSTKPLRYIVPYTSSHRGIFCLYGQYNSFSSADDFILWNPATREVKLVTPPPSYVPRLMGNVVGYHLFFGFGGDPDLNILVQEPKTYASSASTSATTNFVKLSYHCKLSPVVLLIPHQKAFMNLFWMW
ncbi:hypothetical protein RIF29_24984 [Crotalaria pallida]|uniref:F-box domain-containing protein n=1 Tax=Crotalaria pallida TaxID=3830 RepID=A0AAN9ELB2_CROPI